MSVAMSDMAAVRPELVPIYIDTSLVVTPTDNPVYPPASLAELLASVTEFGQLIPGFVCPAPELPADQRVCLEGNRRLAVARILGKPFWAFDLGRPVPEDERIKLMFQHNKFRRVMSRDEIARQAARYIEITGCTAGEAAKLLNVSGPTLSRAFGDSRIPKEWRPRADQLGLSIRSLIAAVPVPLMPKAIAFAETPGDAGRKPTRDEVSFFIRDLKKAGGSKPRKVKDVTVQFEGRTVTFSFVEKDSPAKLAEAFKFITATIGKNANASPDGWQFLFP